MRIVTYNIACQALSVQLLEIIDSFSADIILLQEIEEYEVGLTKACAADFGFIFVYEPSRSFKSGSHGLAILSKWPIIKIRAITLPYINLHINSRSRIALVSEIQTPHGLLTVSNVHLDTRLNIVDRIKQLQPVVVASRNPAILGGDFNTVPIQFYKNLVPIGLLNQKNIWMII